MVPTNSEQNYFQPPLCLHLSVLLLRASVVPHQSQDTPLPLLPSPRALTCPHLCVSTAPYCSLGHTLKNGGILNRTTGAPGSKVHYFCKSGYHMIGHSNATCRRSPEGLYQWDALTPICQGKMPHFGPMSRHTGLGLPLIFHHTQRMRERVPGRVEGRK